MINMKDNSEVKSFIQEKMTWLENEIQGDKAQYTDPCLSQQARGRVARGEWALKTLGQIKDMLM